MYNPSQQSSKCGHMNYDILLLSGHQTFKAITLLRSLMLTLRLREVQRPNSCYLPPNLVSTNTQKTKANQVHVGSTESALQSFLSEHTTHFMPPSLQKQWEEKKKKESMNE
jgi:hypothetical protein